MKFTKAFLQDRLEGDDTMLREIIGKGRWSVHYREVFKLDGKFYETRYGIGATESQDESPYDYDSDEIECPEVQPVVRTVIVYESVEGK